MELLGFHMFGSAGKTMVEISVIGFLMGTCIAFYVVIGDLSPLIISKIFNVQSYSHDAVRRFLIILITIICVIPLCFQKSIASLSFVCQASIGFYICLTLKTVAESVERFESDSNWASNIELWKPSGVLQCIPIFSMAMSCQMQLFEVYETMGFPVSFDRIKKTVHQATLICCVVYCVVGFFGYLAFYNQKLSGNVLMNFRPSIANDAITIGFILSIACSFPLVIFPCRTALASFLHRKGHHSELAAYVPESKYKLLTLFIIFTTMVLGILIPSVEVIISLVGSTIGVLVCILFPATCFVKIMQRNTAEKTFAQILIVFGFVIMILGTYANLTAIDAAKSGSHLEEKLTIAETLGEHPKDTHNSLKAPEIDPVKEPEKLVEDNVKKKDEVTLNLKPNPKEPEVKISSHGIKKEEQEIADEKKASSKDPQVEIKEKNEEIQELKESKDQLQKEVLEMKEELVKQNKETQQLVLQKFEEIAEKVDKIEKQSLESGPSAKEKALTEEELAQNVAKILEPQIEQDLVPLEKLRANTSEVKAVEPQKLIEKPAEPIKVDEAAKPNIQSEAQEPQKLDIPVVVEPQHEAPKTEKPQKPPVEHREDPIVKLIRSQEPLSYQVGEKMMERKSTNITVKEPEKVVLKEKSEHIDEEIKNEMRKKRDTLNFDEALDSLDKTLQNFEMKSMIGRDLKATSEEN